MRDALGDVGVTTTGMTLTRHAGTLITANGPWIGYHHGFFWWPAGCSRRGRPLYAIHPAIDPGGVARRLAPAGKTERDTPRCRVRHDRRR
jgi:hypothetical protein